MTKQKSNLSLVPPRAQAANRHDQGQAHSFGSTAKRRELIVRALQDNKKQSARDSANSIEHDAYLASIQANGWIEEITQLCETLDRRLLAQFVQREAAPAAALVLTLAAPEVGAAILRHLDTNKATEILFKVANLDETTPSALEAVAEALRDFEKQNANRIQLATGPSGAAKVASLLAGLDSATREALLVGLENTNGAGAASDVSSSSSAQHSFAQEVRKSLVSLEMVSRLLPRDLSLVLSTVKETEIALALFTQSEDLRERMAASLSQRRRECLHDELGSLASKRGQIRRRDVENAMGNIINAAIAMHSDGKIVFPWEEDMV